MKKSNLFVIVLSIVLAITMCFSLVGCGNTTPKENDISNQEITQNDTEKEDTNISEGTTDTVTTITCPTCDLDEWDCICFDSCIESGCTKYEAECGCILTNHLCDESRQYSHGHSVSQSVGSSTNTSVSESVGNSIGSSVGAIIGAGVSASINAVFCDDCALVITECICSDECKESGCTKYEADCGCILPDHKCPSHEDISVSHSHSHSSSESMSSSTGNSVGTSTLLNACENCGSTGYKCICSDTCVEKGCTKEIGDCGCVLVKHNCSTTTNSISTSESATDTQS